MGKRRRNLFVLLFVLRPDRASRRWSSPTRKRSSASTSRAASSSSTRGRRPASQPKSSGEDIERSIEIIRERIDQLGVSEPEVARLGTDEISVSLPDVTNAERAIEQVGSTAQLYFYDWEPNLIGREKAIGGHPGQQPPTAALKEANEEWKEAGRNADQSSENQQLIFAGAYPTPTARPARRRTGTGTGLRELLRRPNRATTCSEGQTRTS